MAASEGGISYETALKMTLRQAEEMTFALALAQGADIDWDNGKINPPKALQQQAAKEVARAVHSESMSFHI